MDLQKHTVVSGIQVNNSYMHQFTIQDGVKIEGVIATGIKTFAVYYGASTEVMFPYNLKVSHLLL